MKKRNVFRLLGYFLLILLVLTACSSKYSYKKADMDTSNDFSAGSDMKEDMKSSEVALDIEATVASEEASALSSTSALGSGAAVDQTQDKIIRRFYMEVETQEFDSLISKIDAEISRLNGYIEASQISGKRYYDTNNSRYGDIVVRIPSNKVDEFVSTVDEKANVIDKQENTENVTLEYIDMQSRKETLEIEQERLFAILGEEKSLDNIITLESRLSDIRYELQNYESKLRYYDNLVEYSTVTLNIQEVERITPVKKEKQTVGSRIKNGFSDTMYDISQGFQNFFVWFVVNLPYLLIWGVIIGATVFFTRRGLKKNRLKKAAIQPHYGQQQAVQHNQAYINQNQTNPGNINQGTMDQGNNK